jgi:hypothetical protein
MNELPTPHTYQQAADALGIEAEAVRARLRRGALRRGPLTNDRRPTVLLSPAEIATIRAGVRTHHPEAAPDSGLDAGADSAGRPDERGRTISALEAEAATLREAVGRERERADKAEAAAAVVPDLRERLGRAEGESGTLREQARAERDRAEAERGRAEAARAELADWTAGGPLARAWRALVHRRGRP